MKKKIYNTLIVSKTKGDLSWYFDIFLITLISLNVAAIILESVVSLRTQFHSFFHSFEVFSVIIFTVEYVLRIWTANLNPKFEKYFSGNFRYALTPMAIIDLFAILPFYLPFFGVDLRLIRIMRIFKIFRLFKIARYLNALTLMGRVFQKKREELIVSLIFTLFLLLIASTFMYYIENDVQPENFSSIPETMWWGIATLTTVGYGDVYPITAFGKFLGGIIAIIGIGLFALPTGILASGFSSELSNKVNNSDNCDSCGQKLPEEKV